MGFIIMRKIMLGAGVCLALAFAVSEAVAMGGGPTPAWASPYAILVPQTVAPEAAEQGRAAFEGTSAFGARKASKRPTSSSGTGP
jgi:hypothetical protein